MLVYQRVWGWFILVVILPIPGKIGDTTQPFLET